MREHITTMREDIAQNITVKESSRVHGAYEYRMIPIKYNKHNDQKRVGYM